MTMTISERREAYRRDRGYIGTGGIVICGGCYDDLWYRAAQDARARLDWEQEAWEHFNPGEGDDWCSICDRDITKRWRDA